MLRALCRHYRIVPEPYLIPSESLSNVSAYMVAHGGFAEVYKGKYTSPDGGSVDVALKILRAPVLLDNLEESELLGKVCASSYSQ